MVFVGLWGIANSLQGLFVCHVNKATGAIDFSPRFNTSCHGRGVSFLVTGVFNCAMNLIINFLPLYTIWSLKTVSVSTRWGLTAIFLLSIK